MPPRRRCSRRPSTRWRRDGAGRQRVVAAHRRPAGAPGRGGVARVVAAAPRRPAVRGGPHQRRHRERQPRGQGDVLGPPRGGPAPPGSSPARSSTTRSSTPSSGWPPTRARRDLAAGRREGRVDPEVLAALLERSRRGALVSVMWANNEVGTVQPVPRWWRSRTARRAGAHRRGAGGGPAAGRLRGQRRRRDDDHRAQVRRPDRGRRAAARPRRRAVPLLHGGGQERDVRSGTLDTPAVAGLAVALELAVKEQPARAERLHRCATTSWQRCSPPYRTRC